MPETPRPPSTTTTTTFRISPTVSTSFRDARGYWLPVIVIWNLALVVSVIWTVGEMPLFALFGFRSLVCSIHMLLLLLEYYFTRRRNILYPPPLISTGIRLSRTFLALDNMFSVFRYVFGLSFPVINQTDISIIPKYRFDGKGCRMIPAITNGPYFSVIRLLQAEDAECCICLCKYEDKEELNSLPCKHHFHDACLLKWLTVKPTCPLCKRKYIVC